MNYVDVILLLIIGFSIYNGYRRGFILAAVELFSWIATLIIAFYTYPYLSEFLSKHFPSLGIWTNPLSFMVILLLGRSLLAVISGLIISQISNRTHYSLFNRLLGTIPGAVTGFVYAAVISIMFMSIPLWQGLNEETQESKLAANLTAKAEQVNDRLSPVYEEAVKRSMNKMTIHPGSKETVKLPFNVKNPKVREDLEAEMLILVNQERAKEGLKPLKADPEMQIVARKHSVDMFARSYFSHYNPEGKDPFDRMKAEGVRYMTAGENLALAQTLNIAHDGLMNSPGHRANILHKAFGRVGIGILDGGVYGIMVTQNFRN